MSLVKKMVVASAFLGALAGYVPTFQEIQTTQENVSITPIAVVQAATAEDKPKPFITNFDEILDKEEEKTVVRKGNDDSIAFIEERAFYVKDIDTNTKYKEVLGGKLVGILEDECKAVEYILKDFGQGSEDLVVVCYEKSRGMYKRAWAVNVDDVCRVYAKLRKAGVIKLKSYLTTEHSMGEVNTRKMSYNAAEELLEILTTYLPNNDLRCQNFRNFIKLNYGPTGPSR
jgi:hypothetical protein